MPLLCGLTSLALFALLQTAPTTGAAAPAPTSAPVSAPASRPAYAITPVSHEPAGFLVHTVLWGPRSEPLRYSVFVPPEYDQTKLWPVILFLHGSGERGQDGLLQTEVGLGRAIRRNAAGFPAIVVMPQCPAGRGWEGDTLNFAIHCLDRVSRQYRLDPQRLYITGLSMGGFGAWYTGAILAPNVAALAPICGFVSDPRQTPNRQAIEQLVPVLRDLPIWAAHGAKDQAVPVQHTRDVVDALKLAGATNLRYVEVPDGDHNVWDRTYDDPEFWKWLLAQRRGPAPASQPASSQP